MTTPPPNDLSDLQPEIGPAARRRLRVEIAIVLALSLGASAVYALVAFVHDLVDLVVASTPISDQTASINPSLSTQEAFDLVYQLLAFAFGLAPVALALYLLWPPGLSPFARFGLDRRRPRFDLGVGLLLVPIIGIPGIGVFLLGRLLGITVDLSTNGLGAYWWSIPVLILSALRAALVEEVIVVGYLFTRLREFGWRTWAIIVASALLRGSYHLYQGVGAFVGNAAMGVLFGWVYTKWGRTMPLVITHFILDVVSFVGYPLLRMWFPALLS
ncbi:CPBP family intramembrane glutamic endopeptidase [Naasia lichenicola]|uniref:CPBP family intramembrane metalloprotease n=1 Tax=Naasia lichenicola TaxID=2565933 RepID=A0A4S4FEF5_9MICO|nr:CPBP family intramembrane glutamic endopeptidase [Naasia lichenicola]THG28461.1 CPBP family intramembrane metalloprotease [Naasia lichenicola]